MTAKDFALEAGISYPIIMRWLKEGKLKGAERHKLGFWEIPAKLVKFYQRPENKPKRGWKKGRPRKAEGDHSE